MSRATPRSPAPFAAFEWMIAWRYLRAKRAEGGVSTMTWISLIGITLAVFALIATLAVRSGFREEFVDTIVGTNAHVTVYYQQQINEFGQVERSIEDFDALRARISARRLSRRPLSVSLLAIGSFSPPLLVSMRAASTPCLTR